MYICMLLVQDILSLYYFHRFRVLLSTMLLKPDRVEVVVMAACCLHNLLRSKNPSAVEADTEDPITHDIIPGGWRGDRMLADIPHRGGRGTSSSKEIRIALRNYFVSEAGSVPWQLSQI